MKGEVMSQVLKVDEWQGGRDWYVADVKTWTGWHAMARTFGISSVEQFIELLRGKYNAEIMGYNSEKDLLLFSFPKYKDAHQLKLDVNRIARKQNIQVEKWVKY